MTKTLPATNLLEEKTEFASVTTSREQFLKLVETLESQPYRRHIITKHGTPRVVLLSYPAYELLTKVARQALERESSLDNQAAAAEAFERMSVEHRQGGGAARGEIADRSKTRIEPETAVALQAIAALGLTLISREDINAIVKKTVQELQEDRREEEASAGQAASFEK